MSSFLSAHAGAADRIAPPAFRWHTRVLLPALIIGSAAALLLLAAWNVWAPALEVRGTPVVLAATAVQDATASHDPHAAAHSSATASTVQAGGTSVQAAGWVEPLPYPVYATALAEGVIEEVLVLEGDRITRGQPVARLVSADARLALDRARGEEHSAAGMLAAAKATIEHLVAPTEAVKVAEAKVAAADASLEGFTAEEAIARAALREREEELNRKRELVAAGAVSELEVKRLEIQVEAETAKVAALPSRKALLVASREEAAANLNAARLGRNLLIEERANLAKAEGEHALAMAGLREAELRLRRMTIDSPIDGVVLARLVSPGMMVSPAPSSLEGGRVLSLYDPKQLQVRADVPNADIALVGIGQAVEIKAEALPNATIRGEVLRITSLADIAKNTVQVKVRVVDPPPDLRPEMLCRVRILAGSLGDGSGPRDASGVESARQRVFAPKALLRGDHAVVASALRDGVGRAEKRTIVIGSEVRAEWIEVREGLRPGDVLLDPAIVTDGARVRVSVPRVLDDPFDGTTTDESDSAASKEKA